MALEEVKNPEQKFIEDLVKAVASVTQNFALLKGEMQELRGELQSVKDELKVHEGAIDDLIREIMSSYEFNEDKKEVFECSLPEGT